MANKPVIVFGMAHPESRRRFDPNLVGALSEALAVAVNAAGGPIPASDAADMVKRLAPNLDREGRAALLGATKVYMVGARLPGFAAEPETALPDSCDLKAMLRKKLETRITFLSGMAETGTGDDAAEAQAEIEGLDAAMAGLNSVSDEELYERGTSLFLPKGWILSLRPRSGTQVCANAPRFSVRPA